MKKIHLFIILFSTQNGKFKFKDLNELELELELEQKKLRGRSLAPWPLFTIQTIHVSTVTIMHIIYMATVVDVAGARLGAPRAQKCQRLDLT